MKRIIASFTALLLFTNAFAEVVGQNEASAYATSFMKSAKGRSVEVKNLQMVRAGKASGRFDIGNAAVKKAVSAASAPSYYVFNNPDGGWVIIAADDSVYPVLAYSDTGRFSDSSVALPDNLQWWMDVLDAQIQEARANGQGRDAAWDSASPKAAASPVVLLETALWDQSDPYNAECPTLGGTRCLTGCVATAAAIVCHYNQWPDAGKGTTSSFTGSNGVTVPSNTLGREYKYADMLKKYSTTATAAQRNAVSALMYDLGCICSMNYGTSSQGGSGAYTELLLKGLVENMKYSKTAYLDKRGSYTDAVWIERLKSELDKKRPILYSGYDSANGGHQFVFDGYNDDNYFHVNWGWSGSDNGYFRVTALGKGFNFSEDQDAIMDLVPDRDNTTSYRDNLTLISSMSTTTRVFQKDTPFTVRGGSVRNSGVTAFNGTVCVALYDRMGNFKENISNPVNVSNLGIIQKNGSYSSQSLGNHSCTIRSDMKMGDRIRMRFTGQYSEGICLAEDRDIVAEIVVMQGHSAAELAEATSFSVDRKSRGMTIQCAYAVTTTIRDESSQVKYSHDAADLETQTIDLSSFEKGKYTLSMQDGDDIYVLTIQL